MHFFRFCWLSCSIFCLTACSVKISSKSLHTRTDFQTLSEKEKSAAFATLVSYLFSSCFTHSSETWSTQIHLLVVAAYVQTYASDVGLPHLVCSTGYVTSGLAYCLSEQSRLITHCTSCHEYAPPWVKNICSCIRRVQFFSPPKKHDYLQTWTFYQKEILIASIFYK